MEPGLFVIENQIGLPNVNDCLGVVVSDCDQNLWAENPWIIMLIRGMEVEEVIRMCFRIFFGCSSS